MKPLGPFAIPSPWLFGAQLAVVTSVDDPLDLARVQVRLMGPDATGDALLWARVAVPYAGGDCGAFFIPDVEDEVLVVFVAGDTRTPVVIGGLWNGLQKPPETVPGNRIDRWTLTGKAGTRIAILETAGGAPTIELETPGGVRATLTDAAGGRIELTDGSNRITVGPQGVTVNAPLKVSVVVGGTSIDVTAAHVNVTAAFASFSGIVSCQTLLASAVVSAAYTPGAGNIW